MIVPANPPTRPMSRGIWVIAALGFAAIAGFSAWQHQPREPRASMTLLESLLALREPHPVGTPAGAAHAERVAAALREAGAKVELQRTKIAGPRGAPLDLVNVIGRIEGNAQGPATLVTAHHDSVEMSPGAGDDGSGVVTVIEIARALAKSGTNRDVIFLLSDGEEKGLFGAIAFAAEHPAFDEVGAVVNLDARGAAGPVHVHEIGFNQEPLVRIMQESLPRPLTSSLADAVYQSMPNGSDFSVYRAIGLPGFNAAFIGDPHRYHDPSDVPENLHPGTLGHMIETGLALTRALDRAPPIPNGKAPDFEAWRSRFSIGDPTAMSELRTARLGTAPEPSAQSYASFGQRWILTMDAQLAKWAIGGAALVLLVALTIAWLRAMLQCGAMIGALGRHVLVALAAIGAMLIVFEFIELVYRRFDMPWLRRWDGSTTWIWPIPGWPAVVAIWSAGALVAGALWQLIPAKSAWANVAAIGIVAAALIVTASLRIPAVAATFLPALALGAAAFLLASIMPRAIAGGAAGFAGCIFFWALSATLLPLVPSFTDALGFTFAVVVLTPALLCILLFAALLPGARTIVREVPVPGASRLAVPAAAVAVPVAVPVGSGAVPVGSGAVVATGAPPLGKGPSVPLTAAQPADSPWRPSPIAVREERTTDEGTKGEDGAGVIDLVNVGIPPPPPPARDGGFGGGNDPRATRSSDA